jgi:hypothetical protein
MSFALFVPLLFIVHIASAQESVFPSGIKLIPAKKYELILNEKEFTEIDYPARPCVLHDLVNLIPNETIFIEADIQGTKLVNLKYVENLINPGKTLEIQFKQNQDHKSPFMILVVKNPFQRALKYEAGIQLLSQQGFRKTSTLPVGAKLTNFESWPHPVTRILLKNFELVN